MVSFAAFLDENGKWFGLHPILAEAERLK